MPRHSWPTQNGFHIFSCVFYFVVFLPSCFLSFLVSYRYLMDLKAPRVPSQGSSQGPCVYCGVRGQTQPLTNVPAFIEGVVSWLLWSGTPPFCTNLAIAGKGVDEDYLLTMLHDLIFTRLWLQLLQFKEGPCLLPGQGNGAALEYFTTQTIPCTCFSPEASGTHTLQGQCSRYGQTLMGLASFTLQSSEGSRFAAGGPIAELSTDFCCSY